MSQDTALLLLLFAAAMAAMFFRNLRLRKDEETNEKETFFVLDLLLELEDICRNDASLSGRNDIHTVLSNIDAARNRADNEKTG